MNMKRTILFIVLGLFLAGAICPVLAGASSTNKSWSKIKDIFK